MKKIYSFILISFISSVALAQFDPFGGVVVTNGQDHVMRIEPDHNNVFVLYRENLSLDLYVKHFDGYTWNIVGDAPVDNNVNASSLAVDNNGKAVVAYAKLDKIYVKEFNGVSWVDVGANPIIDGGGYNIGLVELEWGKTANNYYIAFVHDELGTYNIKSRKYNGSVWSDYGTNPLRSTNYSFGEYFFDLDLEVGADNQPVIGVVENDGNTNNDPFVWRHNGTDWQQLANGSPDIDYVESFDVAIDLGYNDIYCVYKQSFSPNEIAMKYFNGSNWNTYGSALNTDNAQYINLIATPNGVNSDFFIAYRNQGTDNKSHVWKNDGAWSQLTPAGGLESVESGQQSLGIDAYGAVYLTTKQTVAPNEIQTYRLCEEPIISGINNDVVCNGNNDGSIDLSVTGGLTPYAYNWTNSATTEDINNLSIGTYFVTVTDGQGCSQVSTSFNISEPAAISGSLNYITNPSCSNSSDGSIGFDVTGNATSPYSYVWNGPVSGNTQILNSIPAGTYTMTMTDANGCTAYTGYNLTAPSALALSTAVTNVDCYGNITGAIDLTVSGGTPGYTYNWSNAVGSQDITALSAGNYSVTVTDAKGCFEVTSDNVTEPTQLYSNIDSYNDVYCYGANDASLAGSATGGTPSYAYQWLDGGASMLGQTSSSLSSVGPGDYSLRVIDGNGCMVFSSSVSITEPALLVADAGVDQSICSGDMTSIGGVPTATGGTTPYTYTWTNSPDLSDSYVANPNAMPSISNSYDVTVVDNAGCIATDVINISVTPLPTVYAGADQSLCANNAAVSLSGTASDVAGVVWSTSGDGSFTSTTALNTTYNPGVNDLLAGTVTLTLTGTGLNGCNDMSDQLVINFTAAPTVGAGGDETVCAENPSQPLWGTFSGASGVIWSGGSGSFSPNNTDPNAVYTPSASEISGGSVTLTLTSTGNGNCLAVNDVMTITINPALIANISSTNSNCGVADGTASVKVTGGYPTYNYSWSSGGASSLESGLVAGSYTVTVTDFIGCEIITTTNVNDNGGPIIGFTGHVDPTCNGINNGSLQANPTGGTTPYNYLWQDGQTSVIATGLPSGNIYLTVTDAIGCVVSGTTSLVNPAAITLTTTGSTLNCFGDADGVVTANASGGTGAFTYAWDAAAGFQSTSSVSNLTVGSYSVSVTDANNCLETSTVFITEPSQLSMSIAAVSATCNAEPTGLASAMGSGGISPYFYLWDNGTTTNNNAGLVAGVYSVTLTDSNACIDIRSTTVTEPNAINLSISTTSVTCGGNDGTATAVATGGNGNIMYEWSDGQSMDVASNLDMLPYGVTATDDNGCTTSSTITITGNSAVTVTVSSTDVTTNGSSDGTVTAIATGGSGVYNFSWSNGGGSSSETNLVAGTYDVTIMDENNCTAFASVVVNEPGATNMTVTIVEDYANQCYGNCDAVLLTTVTGGTSPYTYNWTNGMQNSFSEGTCSGVQYVTVTDNLGNTVVESFTVTEPAPMIVSATATDESLAGACDGSATVDVIANGQSPYSYSWPGMLFTQTINNLCAGDYEVAVNDANGCQGVDIATVGLGTSMLSVSSNTTNLTCANKCQGVISLTSTGGATPYIYSWSNGANGSIMVGLCQGVYTYTVSDNGGQSVTESITVTSPDAITVSTTSTQSICGNNDGTASVSVVGGISPYTYNWSTGAQQTAITGLNGGSYKITITDANGCKSIKNAVVGDVNGPTVSVLSVTDANCGGADGHILVGAFGGASPYTYEWDNGVNGLIIMDAEPGDHHVAVTDANGCVGTATATVGNVGGVAPTLSGVVTNLLDGMPITDGEVEVFGYNPYQARMDVVATGQINSDGSYFIPQVLPIGQYFIVGRANSALPQYANTVPTFYGVTFNWAIAPMVTALCNDQLQADIEIIDLTPLVGTGTIGGLLLWDFTGKNGNRAGDPIPGVDIALEQIPGGIIASTSTDNDGKFQFASVPQTGADTTYGIYVSIPGLDVVQRYQNIQITSEDSINLNYNFLASDSSIYIDEVSAVKQISMPTQVSMILYPNPFADQAFIGFDVIETADVKIEIYNLLGEQISNINYGRLSQGRYTDRLNITNDNSGVYIIKLTLGDQVQTERLIELK